MGSIDRDLQGIYDSERDATRTPAGLVDVVARRAGRRRGSAIAGTAAAGLAVVGLVASLGVAVARNSEPVTTPDQPIEVNMYVGPTQGWQNEGAMDLVEFCGEAAPQTKPISEYFTLSSNVESLADDLSTDVTFHVDTFAGTSEITGTERSGVLQITSRIDGAGGLMQGWLFVQDGIVVGYVDNVTPGTDPLTGVRTWEDGGSTLLTANTSVAVSCEAGEMADDPFWLVGDAYVYGPSPASILPAGDYEAYPVVRIEASDKTDARRTLAASGISTSLVGPGRLAEPGSWDCQQATEAAGLTPIDCVEGLYDQAWAIATVTVPPEFQSPDIDVTLVGVPLPYSRTGEAVVEEPESQWTTEHTYGMCSHGLVDGFWQTDGLPPSLVSPQGFAVLDPLLANSSLTTSAGILDDPQDDGTLEGIVDFEVLLATDLDDSPRFTFAGSARATINDGGPIILDRYSGPTTVTLTLSDVTWCGDPPPEGTVLSAAITGSAVFAPTGGDPSEVAVVLWIAPNGLPWD
ncbi:MAG: hypothetical protein JW722_02470 [Demequinaceae bacterium]|nr:hypothetical protein [Demequinaceae bacterium]